MAVKTREEIIAQISARIGDDTSDEAIALIEDVTDTLSDYETRVNGDGTDWKSEYEKNDKEWREKYISRFKSGSDNNDNDNNDNEEEEKPLTYEALFEEKE